MNNNTRNLFYTYEEALQIKYNLADCNPNNSNYDLEECYLNLKFVLKSKTNFDTIKDLIFNHPEYDVFVYCAGLYPNDFLEKFNAKDSLKHFQNNILFTLVNDMHYLESVDVNLIPNTKHDLLVNITESTYAFNVTTSIKNRFLAMRYYNPLLADTLFSNSTSYYNLYKVELLKLNNIDLLEIPNIFKELKTFHARKNLMNILFNLIYKITPSNRDNFFKVLDTLEGFIEEYNLQPYKDDIDDIRIAYKFLNR